MTAQAMTLHRLSVEQVESYRRDGFLVLRAVFTPSEAADLATEADTLPVRHSSLIDDGNLRCRFQPHPAAMLLLAATLAGLTGLRSYADLVTYTATSAIAGSAITVVFFTVWGRLYGRTHLGRIQAAAQMLTVLASAIGPLAFAAAKEATSSYAPALWASAAAAAMLGAAASVIPLPSARLATADAALPEPQPA